MKRYRRPASAVRRIRNRLLPGAGAATALIVAWAMTASGTLSLWQERHVALREMTVSAGMPGLSVSGFEGLDHEYEPDALQAQTTVVVTNTGNVALHDFAATRALESGSSTLAAAIETRFTPTGGGASADWNGWLSGVMLAPGQSVSYTVTTALDALEVAALAEQDAVFEVAVAATAGASWLVVAENGFEQAVLTPPMADLDDFNSNFVIHSSHSLEFKWGFVGSANGTQFNVTMRRPAEQTSYSLGTAADWYPAMSISSSSIPPALVPAQGTTVAVVVEARRASDSELVARGTLWLTGIGGGQATLATTPPVVARAAAAPLGAAARLGAGTPAPAPAAPPPASAPPAASEPPAVPQAEPSEPSSVVESSPPVELSEPAPESDVTDEIPEFTLEVTQDDGELVLRWQPASAIPPGTTFQVKLAGQPVGDPTAGTELALRADEIPPELLPNEDETAALEVTVVASLGDTESTVSAVTIWVSVDTGGVVSLHTSPVEASASTTEVTE